MSLLPGQIIPQDVPIGRSNEDGTVTVDQNWWLFFYNLAQQVLANGQGATLLEIVTSSLSPPKGTDLDRQISDLQTLIASIPNTAGRIASLERKVADLETIASTALGT